MPIYHYHPETGEYLGESVADPSPVNPETFIIPAFATTVAPPAIGDKQKAIYKNGIWGIKRIK
jgi:hypothetical protein